MAQFVALGIFTGLIYSLVAIGYTLVYGVLRLINFAHSEVLDERRIRRLLLLALHDEDD